MEKINDGEEMKKKTFMKYILSIEYEKKSALVLKDVTRIAVGIARYCKVYSCVSFQ